jgi:hypothetical protein
MSQLSQFSNAYPSSLNDGDALDNLQSDDQQLFNPDLLFSQQSFNSVSDSDFLRPPLPPPPPLPPSLQRVSPDRRKTYILYTDMTKNDFVAWWLKTDFGRKKRMRWDARQQSDVWKYFDQVAKGDDGEPKVICKRCMKVLDHP